MAFLMEGTEKPEGTVYLDEMTHEVRSGDRVIGYWAFGPNYIPACNDRLLCQIYDAEECKLDPVPLEVAIAKVLVDLPWEVQGFRYVHVTSAMRVNFGDEILWWVEGESEEDTAAIETAAARLQG